MVEHFPVHPPTPCWLLTYIFLSSLSHHLSQCFLYSHKHQTGQIADMLQRPDHLSSSEYFKLPTGAVKHKKSFSSKHTIFPEAEDKIHVCSWISGYDFEAEVLFAGEIKSNSAGAFNLTLQTALIRNTGFTPLSSWCTDDSFYMFLHFFLTSSFILLISYFISVL